MNAQKSKILSWEEVAVIPVYPGCEAENGNDNLSECFRFKIASHILRNLQYPEVAQTMGIEGVVKVEFVIDEIAV